MRVMVTGSRTLTDREIVHMALDHQRPTYLIHGSAAGADTFAHEWAALHPEVIEIAVPFPKGLGSWGGNARNLYMLDNYQPEIVLAFFDASPCKGTRHAVHAARARGIPVQKWADV